MPNVLQNQIWLPGAKNGRLGLVLYPRNNFREIGFLIWPVNRLTAYECIKYVQRCVREAFKKKYYLDREIVPIPSDPPTIETVSEYLDSEYW